MAFEVSDAYKEGYWAGVAAAKAATAKFAKDLEDYVKRLELVTNLNGKLTYKARAADQPS